MELCIRLFLILAKASGIAVAVWGAAYLAAGLASWRREPDYGCHPASTRFAVLIAARNEELVIGGLINSLLTQNYPPELYDVYVIPNNCTDSTALAARQYGAEVLECSARVKNKGDVLRFAWDKLCRCGYDAICVFDADNVAHPDFLAEMNNAYRCGVRAAQGYRDSKNPFDSPVSGCYSIYYWMMDRFFNRGKGALGLSAIINGTGFMVSAETLDGMGGWRTGTISEDMEMTTQCALAGVRIAWVPKARTYDEQPLTFRESVKQRRRWSTGTVQVAAGYLARLVRGGAEGTPARKLDQGLTLLIPAYQAAVLLSAAMTAAAAWAETGRFSAAAAGLASWVLFTALFATGSAVLVLAAEGRWDRRLLAAVGFYWLFVLSWFFITVSSIFHPATQWEEIRHTRNLSPPVYAVKGPVRKKLSAL